MLAGRVTIPYTCSLAFELVWSGQLVILILFWEIRRYLLARPSSNDTKLIRKISLVLKYIYTAKFHCFKGFIPMWWSLIELFFDAYRYQKCSDYRFFCSKYHAALTMIKNGNHQIKIKSDFNHKNGFALKHNFQNETDIFLNHLQSKNTLSFIVIDTNQNSLPSFICSRKL